MSEETAEEKKRTNELANEWDEERKLRRVVLEVQAAEALLLHGQFEERNKRIIALDEARLKDCLSVVRHRAELMEKIDEQTKVMQLVATAMERIATAIERGGSV